MSWLSSISLPNPFFKAPPDNDDHTADSVKDDISAIGESISRQFRGVAAFLAPPPHETADASPSSSAVEGIQNDLAEIGGTFKSFFSNPNKAVSDISKLASDFLLFNQVNKNDDDDEEEDDDDYEYEYEEEDELYGGGVNDQVIDFARQISQRPELWIDFPLPLDNLDFDMSQEQSEHASIIEQVVPELAHLRNRMTSEKQFWIIYFILLLPRLTAHQIHLLSTPPITQARDTLLTMLRTKKCQENNPDNSQSNTSSSLDNKVVDDAQSDNSRAIGNVSTTESESDTTRIHEVAAAHKNDDYLPEEEKRVSNRFQTEDDVSFSDLEDDENDIIPNRDHSSGSKIKRNSSTEGSSDWVRLNDGNTKERHGKGQSSWRDRDSEGYESTDWLTVDDFDS